ncbi:MAG: tricarballylate dehydrogenase [Chloroflexi bacterium]|nr:tricarballylate dehydrogenase [Chloroflexota bacterium]|tara:strand:- start:18831 stop:20306 length:1476 start_codon:yes stop_codon:yes gene_type:complete
MQNTLKYDVVIVGAGNAALCAALAAKDQGAKVLIIEKAPQSHQGGNCPYTGGGFRFVHDGLNDLLTLMTVNNNKYSNLNMSPYTNNEFKNHMLEVTKGNTDKNLMETIVAESRPTINWMTSKGVKWELPSSRISSSINAPSTIPNSVGLSAYESGPGLIKMLTKSVNQNAITILYETEMTDLVQNKQKEIHAIVCKDSNGIHKINTKAVVLACGGFEANPEMREKHLGKGWENAKVRGSKFNTGDGHKLAIQLGAQPTGQWSGCHATPIDINAPATGDQGITERMPRRSYPLGITVNIHSERFIDEGEGFAEQTFVKMGSQILSQDKSIAFQIFDSKSFNLLEPRYNNSKPTISQNLNELAIKLKIPASKFIKTMTEFNKSASNRNYSPKKLDGISTNDLKIPKSNWGIKIDTPPFYAYCVTGGITYTYGGPKIDTKARVLDQNNEPIIGLYAAGEIVGGILFHNSLRGAGLMHGSVFGKIAGTNAAILSK